MRKVGSGSAQGFSLIETMIAAGLLGALALFATTMLSRGSQGQKTLQAQDDARVLTEDMAALLSNPGACAATFGGAAGSPNSSAADPVDGNGNSVSNIVDGSLKAQFKVGSVYGNRGLKLAGITVGGAGTDGRSGIQRWVAGSAPNTGTTFVQVNWLQTGSAGNQGIGPQNLYRYFMVFVSDLDSSNHIVGCTAQAGGAGGYWTLNSNNNIYNNNNGGTGFVGVGTSTPATNLDVNGGIRASAVVAGAACSPLGIVGYDGTLGGPLYCDGTGHWKGAEPPSGTLCGMITFLTQGCQNANSGGYNQWTNPILCNGVDPHVACPTGYTFKLIYGADCNTAYSCVKN